MSNFNRSIACESYLIENVCALCEANTLWWLWRSFHSLKHIDDSGKYKISFTRKLRVIISSSFWCGSHENATKRRDFVFSAPNALFTRALISFRRLKAIKPYTRVLHAISAHSHQRVMWTLACEREHQSNINNWIKSIYQHRFDVSLYLGSCSLIPINMMFLFCCWYCLFSPKNDSDESGKTNWKYYLLPVRRRQAGWPTHFESFGIVILEISIFRRKFFSARKKKVCRPALSSFRIIISILCSFDL